MCQSLRSSNGTFLVAVVLALVFATAAVADEINTVLPGTWIRVHERPVEATGQSPAVHEGSLVSLTVDQLVLNPGGAKELLSIDRENILRLHRRTKKGRRLKGTLVGGLSGLGAGVVIGLVAGDDKEGLIQFSAGFKAVVFAAFLAPVGAVIGALGSQGTEWEALSVSGFRLEASYDHSQLGFTLTRKF